MIQITTNRGFVLAASVAQILQRVPGRYELTINSWHDGTRRQYVCAVADTVDTQAQWISQPSADLQLALSEVMRAANIPVVDDRFWRGVTISVPISLALWGLIIIAAVALFSHVR